MPGFSFLQPAGSWTFVLGATVSLIAFPLDAQTSSGEPEDSVRFQVDGIAVTATRSARPVFLTPAAAMTVEREQLFRLLATTPVEALRSVPGVDVSGVGSRQVRPVIRGFQGQRILLLADGLRLNNARRQKDFGELPALVPASSVERVEVVKGPASVLYGTDAIGGVLNLVTRRPQQQGVSGTLGIVFGSAQDEWSGTGNLRGQRGRWDFDLSADRSKAGSYVAPTGSFGSIRIGEDVRVQGTGSQHWSLRGDGGFEVARGHRISLGGSFTDAGRSGFGFVDPIEYSPESPLIDISYPNQRFSRFTAGYEGAELDAALADNVSLRVYRQGNERDLRFGLTQSIGPGATLAISTNNFTDIETRGFRLETKKLVQDRVLVTYGLDGFRDASENTDVSNTLVTGFGPPQMQVDSTPQTPNAHFGSLGIFAQGEAEFGDLTVVLGGRGQRVSASTQDTPGLSFEAATRSQWTVVGAANFLFRVADEVVLVGSLGRGFRAPNLIELFFEGPVPEARAYQLRNPGLEAETSVSFDLGARYRGSRAAAEVFYFQSDLNGGIRATPTGDTIGGFAAFQDTNLEALRYRGVEGSVEIVLGKGISSSGGFTWLSSEDRLDANNPIGDTFDRRVTASVDYQESKGRFWARFDVRRNGERKDVALGTNPLGPVLPSFTVLGVSGGIRINDGGAISQRLVVRVQNLTDQLYAEFPNAGFFRPAPGRRLSLGLEVGF